MILLVGTLVLAHLLLKSVWSKTALLILLLPMTIAKNGLRIFVLATLGMYVDPSFLTGRLHHNGGVVFFALAFGAMWGIARFLQRMESRQPDNASAVTRRPAPPVSANPLL
jgi:exosortase/archaeosortase family protein